jgi:hypothetical protein
MGVRCASWPGLAGIGYLALSLPKASRWLLRPPTQAEAARRLQNAKRSVPPPPVSSRKRRVVEEVPSDDGDGEEAEEDVLDEPAVKAPKPRVKRGVLLDSDDDD